MQMCHMIENAKFISISLGLLLFISFGTWAPHILFTIFSSLKECFAGKKKNGRICWISNIANNGFSFVYRNALLAPVSYACEQFKDLNSFCYYTYWTRENEMEIKKRMNISQKKKTYKINSHMILHAHSQLYVECLIIIGQNVYITHMRRHNYGASTHWHPNHFQSVPNSCQSNDYLPLSNKHTQYHFDNAKNDSQMWHRLLATCMTKTTCNRPK